MSPAMLRRGERGAATVLAVAMMGLLVAVTVAVTCGTAVVAAHRIAQSAADLASLAGAAALQSGQDPCSQASAVARRNRARLLGCVVDGWNVAVVVVASARLPVGVVRLQARGRAGPVASLDAAALLPDQLTTQRSSCCVSGGRSRSSRW